MAYAEVNVFHCDYSKFWRAVSTWIILNNLLNSHDCTGDLSNFSAFEYFRCIERKGLCYYVSDCTGASFTACQVLPGRQGWISPPADVPIDHGARFCCMENK
jgi:hypothetical protein